MWVLWADLELSCGFCRQTPKFHEFWRQTQVRRVLPPALGIFVGMVELVLFFLSDKYGANLRTFFQVPHCKCYKQDQYSIVVYVEGSCLTIELLVAHQCKLLDPLVRLRTLLLLLGYEFSMSFINGPNLSLPNIPFYEWSLLKPNQFNLSFAKTIYHGFR